MYVLLSVGLCLTAYVTFSFSWGLCNVVLLLVKALSFRAQEIKASAHQFHEGAAIVVSTVERFTRMQTINLKIDVMHWFHFF